MKQPVYPPGTIIAGRYRVDKAIARGGCSIVYRGTHLEMGRSVALKLMTSVDGQTDRAWVERFKREARLASQLHHPNTITIYDYGASSGVLFITMEWVEGDSLRNVIRAHGAMAPKRVAHLTTHLLMSLAEAHLLHILHRDLKPSNIMLTQDVNGLEMIKVLDFGLAKANPPGYTNPEALKLTKDGDFVGTPRYAAPEQLRGKELTKASDIYGVGMVMWEMLTGKPAVPDVDFGTCVLHHLGPNPWLLPPELRCPPALAKIVERALLKDSMQRYQSCEEMLAELRALLDEPGLSQEVRFGPEGGLALQVDLGQVPNTPVPKPAPKPAPAPSPSPLSAAPPVPQLELTSTDQSSSIHPVAPSQQNARSFDQLSAQDLELDRTVSPAQRPRPASSGAGARSTHAAPANTSPEWVKGALIGLIVLVLLGVGAMVARSMLKAKADPTSPNPETPSASAAPKADPSAANAALDPKQSPPSRELLRALMLLKRAQWDYDSPVAVASGRCIQHPMILRHRQREDRVELRATRCPDLVALASYERADELTLRLGDDTSIKLTPGEGTPRAVALEIKTALERLGQDSP